MTRTQRRETPDAKAPVATPNDPVTRMSERLLAQTLSLDTMFDKLAAHAELADRNNWPTLIDRYTRLALRAQSNYRSSMETFVRTDRSRQPRDGDKA